MNRKRKNAIVLSMVCLIVCGFCLSLRAAVDPEKVDLTKMVQETQWLSQDSDRIQMVWWIPTVYWSVALSKDPTVSKADAQKVIEAVEDYVIVAFVDGKMDAYGNIDYRNASNIRDHVAIKDKAGTVYKPLGNSEIKSDTREMLASLKPLFANMLGNMGQNLHVIVFTGKNAQRQTIVNPSETGEFIVLLDGKPIRWKLPMTSLFPTIECEKCRENCNGAWNYCPWCGTKITRP
jgi:hypothetical protein